MLSSRVCGNGLYILYIQFDLAPFREAANVSAPCMSRLSQIDFLDALFYFDTQPIIVKYLHDPMRHF